MMTDTLCETCDNTGWEPVYDGENVKGVRRCGCRDMSRRGYADGVPPEFQDAKFSSYRVIYGNKAAVKAATAFMTGKRDLYVSGPVGCGKTRLACTVLNEHYRQFKTGLFVRVPMVLYQLQPHGNTPQDESAAIERELLRVPVLVMDDVGSERDQATDYTRRTLLMLYEGRGDKGLQTIWTSNKTLGQLSEMQGDDRLASRIAGRAVVVEIDCPDQRVAQNGKE